MHGGSKQGKTVLRRKHLSEAESIVVSCGPDDTIDTVFLRILANTGAKAPSSTTKKSTSSGSGSIDGGVGLELPFIAKARAKASLGARKESATSTVDEFIGSKESIDSVITAIRASRRRLVIEDFHYLVEEERRKLSFALKAMWDAKVFVIIIGIWA